MKLSSRFLVLSAVGAVAALVGLGCAQPHYDATLGVTGVPIDDGALAGTFGRVVQAADLADLPALGPQEGGGQTFGVVTRTWDGQAYAESSQVCAVHNFDVAGLHTEISQQTARAIPPYTMVLVVDHGTGEIGTSGYIEEWALKDVGAKGALPTTPDDPHVVDMEGDSHPGATVSASGLATGELYVVQRKTITITGVVTSPDDMLGLVKHKKEASILDATNDLLKNGADRTQHPDPKQSWWHEVRLQDGAGCDDIDAAMADGTLSDLRPFT